MPMAAGGWCARSLSPMGQNPNCWSTVQASSPPAREMRASAWRLPLSELPAPMTAPASAACRGDGRVLAVLFLVAGSSFAVVVGKKKRDRRGSRMALAGSASQPGNTASSSAWRSVQPSFAEVCMRFLADENILRSTPFADPPYLPPSRRALSTARRWPVDVLLVRSVEVSRAGRLAGGFRRTISRPPRPRPLPRSVRLVQRTRPTPAGGGLRAAASGDGR